MLGSLRMSRVNNSPRWQIILGLLLAFTFGFYIAKSMPSKVLINPATNTLIKNNEDSSIVIPYVQEVWNILNEKFIDPEKLALSDMQESALKGFVRGIHDPYTLYMTPDESKEFQIDLDGELEGIGAVLESKDGVITVVSVVKESPAAKAGLQSGDIVYKIEGESTEKESLLQAVKKIRGKKGTKVTITIIRPGERKSLDFTLVRDEIHIDSVTLEKHDAIFHISINQFNQTTKKEFDSVVQKILLEKPKALIVDVRGNGGGFLDTSVDIISEFVKKDTIISRIKTRDPSVGEILKAPRDGRLMDIPVVVLVDEGSASASEILAGAFQDHKRGILIGEKTFGKGSVQELNKVRNGGLLRTTIAKWYTPNDRSIDESGIKPDIEVAMTAEDAKSKKDPQLDEAIRYLLNK